MCREKEDGGTGGSNVHTIRPPIGGSGNEAVREQFAFQRGRVNRHLIGELQQL